MSPSIVAIYHGRFGLYIELKHTQLNHVYSIKGNLSISGVTIGGTRPSRGLCRPPDEVCAALQTRSVPPGAHHTPPPYFLASCAKPVFIIERLFKYQCKM